MIENYRPISLLWNVSQVFEKLFFNEFFEIKKPAIDYSKQGLRRHRSVLTQLLLFLDFLCEEHDEKQNEFFLL